MTTNTKVKLCVLGDILLLAVFAFVPYLWLKVLLMVAVGLDLVLGLRRWGWLLKERTHEGYIEIHEYEDDEEEVE